MGSILVSVPKAFVEIGYETISTAIISLPLIQEGQLSITDENMDTQYWFMHQSFVNTAPTYGDGRGIAGLMCGAVAFLVPPQCRASARLVQGTGSLMRLY